MKRKFNCVLYEKSISDGIAEFLQTKYDLVRVDKLVLETVDYYEEKLERFLNFVEADNRVKFVKEADISIIESYIKYRRKQNAKISNQTINSELRAIRACFRYFMKKGYINYFEIELLRKTSNPRPPYKKEEQIALIKKPNLKKCSFCEYRNWVMTNQFLYSGARSKTIRNIKIKDIDLKNKIMRLEVTKNHEPITIPLIDPFYTIIKEYLVVRKGEPEEYLYCTVYGKQLTADGLRVVMNKYNKLRGVETTGLYRYKNTFVDTWIMKDGNLKKLQYALGMKTSAMIDEYASAYGKVLTTEFQDYSPLSNIAEEITPRKKKAI